MRFLLYAMISIVILGACSQPTPEESTTTSSVRAPVRDKTDTPRSAAQNVAESTEDSEEATGIAAVRRQAEADGVHLVAICYRQKDPALKNMIEIVTEVVAAGPEHSRQTLVDLNDSAHAEFVEEMRLDQAPLPLALVFAPNGAITRGVVKEATHEEIRDGFVGPRTAEMFKHLQDGRLVFLSIQGDQTTQNEAANDGVQDFLDHPRFGRMAAQVIIDPADSAEAGFLGQLEVSATELSVAATIIVAPPGRPLISLSGATTQDSLLEALRSCGPSCGF